MIQKTQGSKFIPSSAISALVFASVSFFFMLDFSRASFADELRLEECRIIWGGISRPTYLRCEEAREKGTRPAEIADNAPQPPQNNPPAEPPQEPSDPPDEPPQEPTDSVNSDDPNLPTSPTPTHGLGEDLNQDGIADVIDEDIDGDNIPNQSDPDIDGDGIPNDIDPDIDGDGYINREDLDIDGDGYANDIDTDDDGDGILDVDDYDSDSDPGTTNLYPGESPSSGESAVAGGQRNAFYPTEHRDNRSHIESDSRIKDGGTHNGDKASSPPSDEAPHTPSTEPQGGVKF